MIYRVQNKAEYLDVKSLQHKRKSQLLNAKILDEVLSGIGFQACWEGYRSSNPLEQHLE